LRPSDNWPDLLISFSLEYRNYTSYVSGGSIDVDNFLLALKASKNFDKAIPYAAILYSPLKARFNAATTLGIPSNGSIGSHNDFGIAAGAEYEFTEKISGRIEGELGHSSSISIGMLYRWSGPWMKRRVEPVNEPQPEPPIQISTSKETALSKVEEVEKGRSKPFEKEEAITEREEKAAEENIRLANELVANGRYDEAIIFYKRAYAADPKNFRAIYNLATAQYLNRDYRSAMISYESAIKLQPRDVDSHLFLGFTYYKLGDLDGAARAWKRVLELDPNNAVALNNLQALNL